MKIVPSAEVRPGGAGGAATPHAMISVLLDGALSRLRLAREEVPGGTGSSLAAAAAIIEALQGSLDLAHGGPLARNLLELYDYMLRRLADAAAARNPAPVGEVAGLLETIREGWDAIAPEVSEAPAA